MNWYGYISLILGTVYFLLGFFVLIKNPKEKLNIAVSLFTFCFSLWSFSSAFYFDIFMPKEKIFILNKLGSLGWISFSSFFVWFALIYTERKKLLSFKVIYFFMAFFPLLFLYKQIFENAIISDFTKKVYGWRYLFSDSIWFWTYITYVCISTIIVVLLLSNFFIRCKNAEKKKEIGIILFISIIGMSIGFVTGIIIPKIGVQGFIATPHYFPMIWVIAVIYVTMKFQFLNIYNPLAAEQIISTMTDSLILTDPFGKIAKVNHSTLILLKYKKEDLEGTSVNFLFRKDTIKDVTGNDILSQDTISNFEDILYTKTNEKIPIVLSGSVIKDNKGRIFGRVFVAHDITKRKMDQEKLKNEKDFSEATINSLPGIFYLFDKNYKFLKWNKNFEIITGYPNNDFLKISFLDFFSEEDRKNIDSGIKEILEKGFAEREASLITRTGKQIPYYFTGSLINVNDKKCIIGTGLDITQRRLAENELKENMADLEQFKDATINRENKMIDLKEEINHLLEEMGKPKKYDLSFLDENE